MADIQDILANLKAQAMANTPSGFPNPFQGPDLKQASNSSIKDNMKEALARMLQLGPMALGAKAAPNPVSSTMPTAANTPGFDFAPGARQAFSAEPTRSVGQPANHNAPDFSTISPDQLHVVMRDINKALGRPELPNMEHPTLDISQMAQRSVNPIQSFGSRPMIHENDSGAGNYLKGVRDTTAVTDPYNKAILDQLIRQHLRELNPPKE